MSRRSVRLFLVLLAVATASAAAYRAVSNEQARQNLIAAARATDRAGEEALAQEADLRAALHAYVAVGQSEAFWTERVAALFDSLRTRALHLDAAIQGPPGEMLDSIDRLAAADKRARDLIAEGQTMMAGDVIFTEVRDLADGFTRQVRTARATAARGAGERESTMIREQYMLAGGALGAWILLALLLLPRTSARPAAENGGVLHVVPQREVSAAMKVTDMKLNDGFDEPLNLELAVERSTPVSAPPPSAIVAPEPPAPRAADPVPLAALASICSDLARITDAASLGPLLARAASALDATGVIVWMAQPGGDLHPAAAHGYDSRLLARLGPVPPGAGNLTASVFREGLPRTSPAAGGAPAAVAVPVAGAAGTIGVFSAELTPAADAGRSVPGAMLVAAQLATLLGAPAAHEGATTADADAVRLTGS